MAKFIDNSRRLPTIEIDSTSANTPAIEVRRDTVGPALLAYSANGYGVTGSANSGQGLRGISNSGEGVYGQSGAVGVYGTGTTGVSGFSANTGVKGESSGGYGVHGITTTGYAVKGESTGTGSAGYFQGNVQVTGSLAKGGGSFKIDHPLDPESKYLYHSFVESPDMMNVYNGNITLDEEGGAVVEMPSYFEALNKEFRYQLTAIGAPGPNLHVSEEIRENRFKIAGGKAGMKVSWQVTGIRQDPYAKTYRIPVEEDKPREERGLYLHPDVYGQPGTKQVGRVDPPEIPDNPQK
jgi:hypothetical protein